MHILFITANFPSAAHPHSGTFVRQLVFAIARQGHQCTVISPVRWLARRFGPLPPVNEQDVSSTVSVPVLRPRMMSFSTKRIGPIRMALLTQMAFNNAVASAAATIRDPISVCYGHFLYFGGYAALCTARLLRTPAVAAVGEGTLWTVEQMGMARGRKQLQDMSGFIAVSTLLKGVLQESLAIPAEKIGVFPNGVDLATFSPRPREQMRARFGVSDGAVAIAFVGVFDELKGVSRLLEAVADVTGVELLLAGTGSVRVHSPQIRFCRRIQHHEVPELLSAADMFVLPTCEEGSCNAVIEAMACGLPIVTSNGPYMDDLLDDDVSIRVDPFDIDALRSAIICLRDDADRRRHMGDASLARSRRFDVNNRARNILSWLTALGTTPVSRAAPRL